LLINLRKYKKETQGTLLGNTGTAQFIETKKAALLELLFKGYKKIFFKLPAKFPGML
jgi:hypothetical protein